MKILNLFQTIRCNLLFIKGWKKFRFPILVYGELQIQAKSGSIIFPNSGFNKLIIGKNIVGGLTYKKPCILNLAGDIEITGKVILGVGTGLSVGKNSKISINNGIFFSGSSHIVY